MKTQHLELLPHEPTHLLALIESAEAYERSSGLRLAAGVREFMASGDVSRDFLAKLHGATSADPWTFGFAVLDTADKLIVGSCGFVGPPGTDGAVEIAYAIAPDYRGRGYAAEVARALVAYALADGRARTIRAHTRPESNASTRVLTKCGFRHIGEINHPEDGLIWRWEYAGVEADPVGQRAGASTAA